MDAAAELGSTRFSLRMEMSRLTRDGTAELVSRGQILRHERGQGNIHFSCFQLTTCRTGNLPRFIHTLAIRVTIHTYMSGVTKCQLAGRGKMSRYPVLFLGVPFLTPKQDGIPLFGDAPALKNAPKLRIERSLPCAREARAALAKSISRQVTQ